MTVRLSVVRREGGTKAQAITEALYETIAATIGPILCVSSNQTNNVRLGAARVLTPVEGNRRGPFPDGSSATVPVCRCLCHKKKRRRRTGGSVIPTQGGETNEEIVRLAINGVFF